MASLSMVFGAAATGGMFAATAAKGGGKEEKSLIDWVLGNLTKQDQFYETDPILQKADEEKASSGTTGGRSGTTSSRNGTTGVRKGTVSVPTKKKGNGGLGGLFAKK